MKFSVLEGGYKTSYGKVEGIISFAILRSMMKNHPEPEKVQELRTRVMTKEEYDEKKGDVFCIKPHGVFEHYYVRKGTQNILHYKTIQLSGFLYFDMDKCDVDGTKQRLLDAHKDKIALMGKSVGGKGLFFYVKVTNAEVLTEENFMQVWEHLFSNVFQDFKIDASAKGLTRNHVIPQEDNLYYNDAASYYINDSVLSGERNVTLSSTDRKCNTQNIKHRERRICSESYSSTRTAFIDIATLLKTLRLETDVVIPAGQDVLIKEIEVFKVPFVKEIPHKQRTYYFRLFVHCLFKLNPDVTLHQLLSYIHYWNQHRTIEPMLQYDMQRTVEREFNALLSGKENIAKGEIITVHVRRGIKNRSAISKHYTGQVKVMKSVNAIRKAIQEKLTEHSDKKLSQTSIAKVIGRSRKCVNQHWKLATSDVYSDYTIQPYVSLNNLSEACQQAEVRSVELSLCDLDTVLQVVNADEQMVNERQSLAYFVEMWGEKNGIKLFLEQNNAIERLNQRQLRSSILPAA